MQGKMLGFSMIDLIFYFVSIIFWNLIAKYRGSSPSSGHLRFFVDKLKKCILFLLYLALIIS